MSSVLCVWQALLTQVHTRTSFPPRSRNNKIYSSDTTSPACVSHNSYEDYTRGHVSLHHPTKSTTSLPAQRTAIANELISCRQAPAGYLAGSASAGVSRATTSSEFYEHVSNPTSRKKPKCGHYQFVGPNSVNGESATQKDIGPHPSLHVPSRVSPSSSPYEHRESSGTGTGTQDPAPSH